MAHAVYVQVLTAMFLFWNWARILTYLPTIAKLLRKDADVRSHSLLTWGSWTLSNATFALMLLEQNHGVPERMFWMNCGNTLMCLITLAVIAVRRSQLRATGGIEATADVPVQATDAESAPARSVQWRSLTTVPAACGDGAKERMP